MSTYEIFNEALMRASNPTIPPGQQPRSPTKSSSTEKRTINPVPDQMRASADVPKRDIPEPPPKSPEANEGERLDDSEDDIWIGFGKSKSMPEARLTEQEQPMPNPSDIAEAWGITEEDVAGQNPLIFAGEPPQSRSHDIDDLFSDTEGTDTDQDGPGDLLPAAETDLPIPGLMLEGRTPGIEPYQHQNPDLVHSLSWMPQIPAGEDGWSQRSQAGSAHPDHNLGMSLSMTSPNRPFEVQHQISYFPDHYIMSGALLSGRPRKSSPTESELVNEGFEFHNQLPEDVQISRFADNAFRKALREISPDLPRKQQWYAWNKVKQMLRDGREVAEDTGGSPAHSRPYLDDADDEIDRQAITSDSESESEGDASQLLYKEPLTVFTGYPSLQGVTLSLPAGIDEVHPSETAETRHQLEELTDSSSGSLGPMQFGETQNMREGYQTGSEAFRNGETMVQERNRALLSIEFRTPDLGLDTRIHSKPGARLAPDHHTIREIKSQNEDFFADKAEALRTFRSPVRTRESSPLKEVESSSPPLMPGFSQSERVRRPDTPRPVDTSIRQSVEPETPRRLLHRESTPAFEARSPTPSPVSRSAEDVEMLDAANPATFSLSGTFLPRSSPNPISSPINVVTARETPLSASAVRSPGREHTQSNSPSRAPHMPPVPTPSIPPSISIKGIKRGEKPRRKSAGVQGTSSKVGKSRNVTRKVTDSIRKVTQKVKAEGLKVAEAVAKIEANVKKEQEPDHQDHQRQQPKVGPGAKKSERIATPPTRRSARIRQMEERKSLEDKRESLGGNGFS